MSSVSIISTLIILLLEVDQVVVEDGNLRRTVLPPQTSAGPTRSNLPELDQGMVDTCLTR